LFESCNRHGSVVNTVRPFGRILFMRLGSRSEFIHRILVPALAALLASGCTSTAPPNSQPDLGASPTPFQPDRDVPGALFSSDSVPLVRPTFTPQPMPYLRPQDLPTAPEPDRQAAGSSRSSLAVVNNPLTGLPPSNAALLERRPMVVKVTNYPRYVRPQSGLSLADTVFEYYIEDSLTRFIAVIYSNDSLKVGPVRSGRYFDEHVTRMYHAYFVFKYADPREYSYFKASDLLDFLIVPGNGACPPFVVGGGNRDTYNNIFFNSTRFGACLERSGLDNSRQALRSSFFSEAPVGGIGKAARVYTRYSPDDYNYWEFDEDAGQYVRHQETADTRRNKPETYAILTDAETGRPVMADNVVVLFVPHTFANEFEAEDEVYHIDLLESGQAMVFRDGIAIPAYWYRTELDQPLVLATALGTPVYLKPGVTFFQVIGRTSTYEQDGDNWRFRFATP